MPSKFVSILPFLLPFASAAPTASQCNDDATSRPTATIDSGPIAGTTTTLPSSNSTIHKFLGIPFAAPPVRFSPPERPESWKVEYDASSYKSACIQKFDNPEGHGKVMKEWMGGGDILEGEKEDCLYINVFTPTTKVAEGQEAKAVLFWIYGGSFAFGASNIRQYDGSWLAGGQDVVVVTFNYRTNVFGFPGTTDLPETKRNLGLLDQRLALDWVQRNIATFGGDPKKVTIFGESAGGGSVDMLITAPPDPLPFRAAIMQSGQQSVATPTSLEGNDKNSWKELVKLANCTTDRALECIRALPATRLRDIVAKNSLGFPAVKDGVTYSKTGRQDRLNSTEEKPLIARVPYMIGNTANEGSLYVIGQNDTAALLRKSIPGVTDEVVQTLLKAYPIGSPLISNETERIDQIITELLTTCTAAVHATDSGSVGIPAWRYYFNASFPNSELLPKGGAYHSSEIDMMFGSYRKENATAWQKETSDVMMKAWADFAKNPEQGPGWDVVEKGEVAVFGGGVRTGDQHWTNKAFERVLSENLDKRCVLYKDILGA